MKFSKIFFIAILLTSFLAFSIVRAETRFEIDIINEEVVSLLKAGEYEDALKLAKKSLQLAAQHYGLEHPDTKANRDILLILELASKLEN